MDKCITRLDNGCRDSFCFPLLRLLKVERPRTMITVLFLISSVSSSFPHVAKKKKKLKKKLKLSKYISLLKSVTLRFKFQTIIF